MKIKHVCTVISFCLFSFLNFAQGNEINSQDSLEKASSANESNISVVDENFEIFLCIGQSNMAGRAEIMSQDMNVLENAFLFNDSSEWEKAENPMNKYSTIRKDLSFQQLSPSWTFAETLEAEGKHVGLIVNARGGTKMQEWVKGGAYYNEALSRALEAQKTGVIKGIIWHQGEGNQNSTSTYTGLFKTMIEGFREDLSIEDLPVIVGEIGKWRESAFKINNVLVDLKNHIPYLDYVSGIGITHLGDDTHFNSESQRVLGRRYAVKYLELSNNYTNVQIPVLEDTYTNGYEPTVIEGNESSAITKNHPDGWERKVYLKFDVSSIPENIISAKLYINAKTSSGGDFDIEVKEGTDDSWNEETTTYNTFTPIDGNPITTFTPSGTSYATPYAVDVTPFALAQQNTDNIITLTFSIPTQNNSNDFRIVTKENAAGEYTAAYLDINYDSNSSLNLEKVENNEFFVYPNPLKEDRILNIYAPLSIKSVSVFGIDGRLLNKVNDINSNKHILDFSNIKGSGIYLIQVIGANGFVSTKKLIVD